MSVRRKIFYLVAVVAAIYAATAAIGSFLADNSKGGCERANISREELYRGAGSDIATANAVKSATTNPEIEKAMDGTIRRAHRSRERLTFSPDTAEPWDVDCEAAYPDPLPWPEG